MWRITLAAKKEHTVLSSLSRDELVTGNLKRLPVNWLNTIQEVVKEIPEGQSHICMVMNAKDVWGPSLTGLTSGAEGEMSFQSSLWMGSY